MRTTRVAGVALTVTIAFLCSTCNKDTPSAPAMPPVTVTLPSEASLDGWVTTDGAAETRGRGPSVGDADSRIVTYQP